MIRLIQNFYTDSNPERNKELRHCLSVNISQLCMDDELVLFSNEETPKADGVCMVHSEQRPTFNDYFKWINENSGSEDINIILNSDIFITSIVKYTIAQNIKQNEVYALARWEWRERQEPNLFDRDDTADVWVFKGKIRDVEECDFTQAKAGCDNAIAERLERAGYTVLNPSRDIRSYHVHQSGIRRYNPRDTVSKPYLLITPHHLGETPQYRRIPA